MIGFLVLNTKKCLDIASGEEWAGSWLLYLISPGVWVGATEIEAK